MENIFEKFKEKAKQNKKTIILPETMDKRVLKATEIILKEDIREKYSSTATLSAACS